MKRISMIITSVLLLTACQESLEERCAKEAQKYTQKNCPAQIDEYTIMDSMTFDVSTHTLHYYYRFIGTADREGLDQQQLREALQAQIKNSTSIRAYKDAKYNFTYTYRSAQNPDVVRFEANFTAKDY